MIVIGNVPLDENVNVEVFTSNKKKNLFPMQSGWKKKLNEKLV